MDLLSLTLMEASNLIQSGQLSPVELTQAYLERIDRLNPGLNAFIKTTAELALSQAKQAEAVLQKKKAPASPLLGIPVTLKDLYETRQITTTAGSRFFQDNCTEEGCCSCPKAFPGWSGIVGQNEHARDCAGCYQCEPTFRCLSQPLGSSQGHRRIFRRLSCGACSKVVPWIDGNGQRRLHPYTCLPVWNCRAQANLWESQSARGHPPELEYRSCRTHGALCI